MLPPSLLKSEVTISILLYSFCSGSLVLVNKLILHHLPYPSLVITVQLLSTILFITVACLLGYLPCDPVRWVHVKPYLLYTVAFSVGVYCNMRSLAVSNVETVIVFRALAPLLVSVLDAMFLGREWPSRRSWMSLLTIAAGAYGYASTDARFASHGTSAYLWPTCYLLVISFEMAYGKRIVRDVDLKTRSGPVLYTNLLGWFPMLLFAAMGREYDKLWTDMWHRDGPYRLPPVGLALLALGCIVGTGIGYTGWWCRGNVSATSFTLIGVMNKCLTVLVNLLIWDQHAVPAGIGSLILCLVGGSFYRQAPMRGGGGDGDCCHEGVGGKLDPPTSGGRRRKSDDITRDDDDVGGDEETASGSSEEEDVDDDELPPGGESAPLVEMRHRHHNEGGGDPTPSSKEKEVVAVQV